MNKNKEHPAASQFREDWPGIAGRIEQLNKAKFQDIVFAIKACRKSELYARLLEMLDERGAQDIYLMIYEEDTDQQNLSCFV